MTSREKRYSKLVKISLGKISIQISQERGLFASSCAVFQYWLADIMNSTLLMYV